MAFCFVFLADRHVYKLLNKLYTHVVLNGVHLAVLSIHSACSLSSFNALSALRESLTKLTSISWRHVQFAVIPTTMKYNENIPQNLRKKNANLPLLLQQISKSIQIFLHKVKSVGIGSVIQEEPFHLIRTAWRTLVLWVHADLPLSAGRDGQV